MKQKVLFICTHNSARSQIAEGFLKAFFKDKYESFSASVQLTSVNPYAVEVMKEIGIDISDQYSKSIEEFQDIKFDYVVTVCDNAKEKCPFYTGKKMIHKNFKDLFQLDGNIGVIANGAGLTMATLDALTNYSGKGGVFLDLGGTDDPEKVKQAFGLMKKAKPKVIFLNLFGGITRCDTVAKGVKEVITKEGIDCPVISRIKGCNEDEAKDILKDAGLITGTTLQDAAQKSSDLAR